MEANRKSSKFLAQTSLCSPPSGVNEEELMNTAYFENAFVYFSRTQNVTLCIPLDSGYFTQKLYLEAFD